MNVLTLLHKRLHLMFSDFTLQTYTSLVALLPSSRIEQVALLGVLLSGLGTVSCTHMVGNVLCLVSAFLWGAVLCLCHQAEFLAFILPVVYIGAVIILFLFVVMMVDFRLQQNSQSHLQKTFTNMMWLFFNTASLGLFLWLFVGGMWPSSLEMEARQLPSNNLMAIGQVLYTKYLMAFELSGIILFVAMIAALWILSSHDKLTGNKANSPKHKPTQPSQGVEWVDAPFNKGLGKNFAD